MVPAQQQDVGSRFHSPVALAIGYPARMQNQNLLLRIAIGLLAATSWSCSQRPAPEPLDPRVTLTLLSTSDFHGALESTATDRDSKRPIGGAPFLTALIERERQKNPEGTLVLDSGDIYQGTALSNLTDGRASIDYMNEAGFDAAAVGNHEFDFGIEIMVDRIEQAEFPVLCANVHERATGKLPAWAKPYAIFVRNGVRVAVIGLATPDTPKVTMPQNVAHLDFLDPAPVANQLILDLVPEEADLVVIAAHMGGAEENGVIEGEMVDLAERVQGETAILGGHTHRLVSGRMGDAELLQAGSSGRWLGRLELTYDRETKSVVDAKREILTVFADSGQVNSVAPDPEVARMIEEVRGEIAPRLEEVIGFAGVELTVTRAECPMGNWMSDVIREYGEADFGFQNPGGVRSPLDVGPIHYEEVYRVMPFDNTIVTAPMTGAEIKEMLETSAARESFLHVSGLKYSVDYGKPEGARILGLSRLGGGDLDPAATYKIATNSFLAQGGDDLAPIVDKPGTVDTGILIREAMAEACRREKAAGREISPEVEGRVMRTE